MKSVDKISLSPFGEMNIHEHEEESGKSQPQIFMQHPAPTPSIQPVEGTGGEGEPLGETQYPTFDDLYDKDDDFLPLQPQEEEDPEDLSITTETNITIATDANQSANEAMPETEGPSEGLSQNQPNKCLINDNSEVPDSSTSTSGATNRNQAAAASSNNSSMDIKDSNNNADEAMSPSSSRSSDELTIDLSLKQGQSSDVTSATGEVSASSSASSHPARGNEGPGTAPKKKKRKKDVDTDEDAAYPVKVHGRNRFNPEKMEAGPFPCQVCGEVFQAPHELTIHIRQHNMEDNSGSHTCKLCGKTLSSQSSLDRHMLVHSGERPFKCKVCKMAFTTNGNMNRHMRIHEKDGELPPPTPEPRQRTPSKRPYYDQDEDWSPRKKVSSLGRKSLLTDGEKEGEDEKEPEQLACPICAKTFICRFGLQSHMETHPDTSVRCNLCHCAFRNHRGLSKHKAMVHKPKLKPSSSSSRSSSPSINANKQAIMGFQELGFTAFSSRKFPLIVKTWCENNEHKCNSALPKFVCQECGKSFPLPKALLLHRKVHSESGVKKEEVTDDENDKSAFLKSLNLCPQGSRAPPKDEHIPLDFFTKVRDSEVVFPVPTNGLRHNTVPLSKLVPILPKLEPGAGVASPMNRTTPSATADFADVQQMLKVAADATMLTAQPDASAKTNLKPLPPLYRIPVTPPHASPSVLRKQPPPPPLKYIPNAGGQMKGTVPVKIRPILPKPTQTSHTNSNNVETMDENIEESQPQSDSDKEELPEAEDVSHAKKGDMYVCEYCSEKFPLARAYKSHVRTHLGLAPYQCRQCNYASPDKSTLVRHLRTHNGERPFQCLLCQYAFTTKANCERHVRKKHNRFTKEDIEEVITYNQFVKDPPIGSAETFGSPDTICKYCGKDFRFFRALQHHLRSHSSCRKKPYQCRLCENGFSTKNNCIRHILKRHENINQKKMDTYVKFQMQLKTESDDGEQIYDHDSVAPQSLELIIKQEPLDYALDTADALSDQPLDFSMKSGRSTDSSHLASPVSLVIDAGNFEQPLDLSFKSTDDSRSESSLSQSASESAPTNTRKYRFKAEYHKYYSTDCDQLVCPMCPMKFSRGGRLEEHIRSHTKERPFKCPHCPSAFTIKSNLDRHLKNHGVTHPSRGRGGNTRGGSTRGGSTRGAKGTGKGRGGAVGGGSSGRGRGGRGRGGRGRGRKPSFVSTILTRARRFIPIAPKPISVTLTVANPTDEPADEKPSLNHSMASDSSGEFASVQNMLAATNPDNFQTFLHSPSPGLDCDIDVQNDPGNEDAEEMDVSAGEQDVSNDEIQGLKKSSYSSSPNRVSCPHCPRTFPWESSLRRHLLTHTGQKPYKCPKCPMKFSTKSNRERHLLRKHNGKEKVVPKTEGSSYQCRLCECSVFTTKSNLHRHYVVKHPDTDLSTFPWDKTESEQDESEESAAEQPPEVPPKDSMESSLDNSLCLKDGDGLLAFHQKLSASTSEALAKAAEICDQISCDIPEEGKLVIVEKEDEPQKAVKKRKRAETESAATAASASASTSSEKASPKQGKKNGKEGKQEEETQSAKKVKRTEVKCKVCGKEFQFMMTLTRHMRVHNLDHPFHCSICDAAFTTKFNCQRHVGRVHNVEHENTETMVVERQEEAVPDAESDANLDLDSQHAATNLVEDSDESCALDAPQKAQSSSKKWSQSPSPVEIDSLSAKFESDEVTSNDGSVDMSSNPTTKRKQQCKICEKRFWSAQDLRRHMRSHTGERPFRCSGCERTFSLKHSLVRHQRACTGLTENTQSPGRERTALDAMESAITEFFSPTDDGLGDFGHDSYSDSASNSFSVQDFSLKSTSEPITIDGLELDPSIMIVQPEDPPNDTFDLGEMDEGRLEDRRHPWDTDSDNGLDTAHNVYLVTPRDSKDILGSAAPDSDTLPSSTLGSDIIQNLLGIQDSSVIDQMLDSADSAARLLGVE
ncbi:RREB1 [Branchiostoma lanceolatum]|uniref:RREB1 protein n=1 Tax=Branchiostoma lanceolatum TaxID=7740 RepID=A0A8K0A5H3_BRALA|nr:RREB1 [Branchiostoma lanceolatum]